MIGVLGGTFDPVHLGHIEPALELLRALRLREIRLIPLRAPSHRTAPAASAMDRWRMLQLAVQDHPGLRADDRELRRDGPSYTVDTLRELRVELGDRVPLCLIMGNDAFAAFTSWHRWSEILQMAHIVVAARPGSPLPRDGTVAELLEERRLRVAEDLTQRCGGGILPWSVQPVDISATGIRAALAAGGDVSEMLPAAIGRYIREHKLYSTVGGKTNVSKGDDGD